MSWLAGLRTAALVGTGRHPSPPPPPELNLRVPDGLSAEELLLCQAALADVAIRASRRPHAAPAPDSVSGEFVQPAPEDGAPQAAGDAARLLDLLLNQPPVGAELRSALVADWLELAALAGQRVPHRLLPALFTLAGTRPAIAARLHPAVGSRGAWLQALRQAAPADVPEGKAGSPGGDAAGELARLRQEDPAAARARLLADWGASTARERSTLLALFSVHLGIQDEELLELALDDKAKRVREVAGELLDRLPDSARAGRMAARLGALLALKGVLRRHLTVDLPPAPDPAAARDGVPSGTGGSDGFGRLETIIRGAPLEVWTTAAGRDPEGTLALLAGEPRVVDAIMATAVLRADTEWVRALLAVRADARLLACLPAAERGQYLLRHLRARTLKPPALVPLLRDLPRPWDPELAAEILDIAAGKDGGYVASMLASVLPTALPAEAAAECRRLLAQGGQDPSLRRALGEAVQYQSFRQSLTEAFR